MKRMKRYVALGLVLCLLLALCACGEDEAGTYRKIETLAEEQFQIAFRQGDRLRDTVTAALAVLAADGTVGEISRRWFGADTVLLAGDAEALQNLGYEIEPRTFIMGLDAYRAPMSYRDISGSYVGFDVELAQAVCRLLGWELQYQPIDAAQAEVELKAGNIDAAWGGMSFADTALDLSPAYMENARIIVARTDSDIKRVKTLEGKDLGMRGDAADDALLDTQGDLREKLGAMTIFSGTERLFGALDGGQCDAILTDQVALDYYTFIGR